MSNTPAKYEVLIKQYLRSILEISAFKSKVTLLPRKELRPVSFNKRQQNEEAFFFPETFMTRACSPNVPSFSYEKRCFQCQFLFSRCKLSLRYTAGNFNENPSMRALI